jgi:hypothetical protein
MAVPGANALLDGGGVGMADASRYPGAGVRAREVSSGADGLIPDGTEMAVAVLVIAAVGYLFMLEKAGFKAVIAASVSAS